MPHNSDSLEILSSNVKQYPNKNQPNKGKQVRHCRRALDGVLLFDKPKGMTSNQALQRIRHRFNAMKAGHSGTLDPMATGLLPICFGEAAKFSTQLLDADKTYEFTCQLGANTRTGDIEGEILAHAAVPQISEKMLEDIFAQFRGTISQIPPMVSALWHEGRRLYDLAREGIEIERQSRELTIFFLELISYDQQSFTARVKCSKGTYIRVLAEDIAERLGTLGHLTMLRRTEVYPFNAPKMYTLEALLDESVSLAVLDAYLLRPEIAIMHLPEFTLDDSLATRFKSGQRIPMGQILKHDLYRVYNQAGEFLGTAYPYMPHVLGAKRMRAFSG